nr:uncharacterized protein CFP56_22533 [Quercus suber]
MPGVLLTGAGERKRKRLDTQVQDPDATSARKAPKTTGRNSEGVQAQILLLEEQILKSREHYNNIVTLHELAEKVREKPKTATLAAVALCRAFTRLIAGEKLVLRRNATEPEVEVARWLKDRLRDYTKHLISWIGSPDAVQEKTAITLLMRIVKVETTQDPKRSEQAWRQNSTFPAVVKALVEVLDADGARQEFVENYVEEFDDVRYYTFVAIKQFFATEEIIQQEPIMNTVQLLCMIEGIPESEEQLEDWYGEPPASENNQLCSLNAHRRCAQDAWLAIFRSALTKDHRKKILNVMTSQILPWFVTRIELLADFMTDSFNAGGSLSLLALSGIFHLMAKQNLDYPDFYTKLYSLLDENSMHNKHRSRFFRLFDTFLNSSHLPAAMVASFIKRLARLSLHAPPGAIVWTIPWVYNMLKQHPACTFMLHRTPHPAHAIYASHPDYAEAGMHDPFSMTEPDPMLTNAIESSLWELETLRSHYHPNVATLAKILGEQFTKREYQLEDFLDHSYAGLIEGELSRKLKKAPEVEWEIPKRIVTRAEEDGGGLNALGGLLQNAIDRL